MKLELKHLAPYLPYGLNGDYQVKDVNENAPSEIRKKKLRSDNVDFFLDFCKPILRPLSDLTNNYDTIINELEDVINGDNFDFSFLEDLSFRINPHYEYERMFITFEQREKIRNKLFEWHFDVFGLIKQGLAIDMFTLNTKDK